MTIVVPETASMALKLAIDQINNEFRQLTVAKAPVKLKDYVVANLPDPVRWNNSLIIVPDESGGYTPAFSDGTNWRRVKDLAIVS